MVFLPTALDKAVNTNANLHRREYHRKENGNPAQWFVILRQQNNTPQKERHYTDKVQNSNEGDRTLFLRPFALRDNEHHQLPVDLQKYLKNNVHISCLFRAITHLFQYNESCLYPTPSPPICQAKQTADGGLFFCWFIIFLVRRDSYLFPIKTAVGYIVPKSASNTYIDCVCCS